MAGRRSLSFVPVLAVAVGLGLSTHEAIADDPDQPARAERCATRLSIALLGESPSAALLSSPDPQAQTADMLKTPGFRERFARFVNAPYNRDPGTTPGQDASYWLARRILETGRPWRDLFVGPFN